MTTRVKTILLCLGLILILIGAIMGGWDNAGINIVVGIMVFACVPAALACLCVFCIKVVWAKDFYMWGMFETCLLVVVACCSTFTLTAIALTAFALTAPAILAFETIALALSVLGGALVGVRI